MKLFVEGETDTFDLLQNRNFETLLQYENHDQPKLDDEINFENYLKSQQEKDNPDTESTNDKENQNNQNIEEIKVLSPFVRHYIPKMPAQPKIGISFNFCMNYQTTIKKKLKNAFSVNTSMCRSELELIQYIIQMNGYMVSITKA